VVGQFFGKRQRTVPSQIFIEGHFGHDLPLQTTVNSEGGRRWR
jgi:hypothetical protein